MSFIKFVVMLAHGAIGSANNLNVVHENSFLKMEGSCIFNREIHYETSNCFKKQLFQYIAHTLSA